MKSPCRWKRQSYITRPHGLGALPHITVLLDPGVCCTPCMPCTPLFPQWEVQVAHWKEDAICSDQILGMDVQRSTALVCLPYSLGIPFITLTSHSPYVGNSLPLLPTGGSVVRLAMVFTKNFRQSFTKNLYSWYSSTSTENSPK